MTHTLELPHSPAAPARTGWDTRLFALRGEDRPDLIARAKHLASHDFDFVETAAALAADLAPGGSRLAVIASDEADLRKKLTRAVERLADPKCKQIRDAAGVYFFEHPLGEVGTLALLYPGEGAQYPDMLLDLCGVFPEVEETFAWCDRLAAEAGRPEDSLRRILHLPPDATPEQRADAEFKLRQLGPSIFGVLLADQAITRVLENLHLPVAAIAGHSAGELGALLAAGAMSRGDGSGAHLVGVMDLMQAQEEESGGPDVALLAVGAGRATIAEVAAAAPGVVVAMDNCPHQCVAVGPTSSISAVEAALQERGVMFERLPFRRPYHTPLFEPWMPPFRDLFAGVPFGPPHTPVYCCSTGELFPADPDAVRQLAVNHWVSPVEFTAMVEKMYADGVRVFVEAGPRGNLSAFVEDILRGRPFAAIPANVSRKSGPTQINHLVGQLAAHHVPVNVGHLFETRVAAGLPAVPSDPGRRVNTPLHDEPHVAALNDYLDVMERFLDVQREVMTAFLAGAEHPAVDTAGSPDRTAEPPFALVETLVHFEPGREVVFRRVMDEREDRYADDHTLGGRGVSRVDPAQNGLPVLPMTFSLEAMAEAASLLAPGKVVVAIRDIRLFRWLPFDPDPTTLEVRAAVASADPETGELQVTANVRDLGNTFLRDAANKVACEAVVVLADHYPDPPAPLPFVLTGEQPCRATVEDLRRNMFHGPVFQMIRSLDRFGPEGIEGTLGVQPRDTWFRSNPDPRIATDPVLTDAAMHILGAWHLEQPDWSGRILLPIGVQKVEFFAPPLPAGETVLLRGHNEEETARQVRHGLELFDANGRVCLRLTGAAYWRFYLPFGEVNFFGPKDQYFLSSRVELPGHCYYLEPPLDLRQPVLRTAGVRVTMTPREIAEFGATPEADREDWFFSRLLAKDAVRAAWAAKHGDAIFPADIETEQVDGRLVCTPRGGPAAEPMPPVAVAIVDGRVAAFSAFADRVGIGMCPVPKGTQSDEELRRKAEQLAIADARPDGRPVHVQVARHKDAVVATAVCGENA
jgi:malonyl CoA-acyl carrier protein transacylase